MFTVWLVSRGCDVDDFQAGCNEYGHGSTICVCMTELCNTGVHQSVGHEITVVCVTVTAVVGRIFYY